MRPRVCAAIFRDDLVLMVLHRHRDGREYWTFPGGGVHPNESHEDAVAREVLEETGLVVKPDRLLFTNSYKYGTNYCYLVQIVSGEVRLGIDPEDFWTDVPLLAGVEWRPVESVRRDFMVARALASLKGGPT